MLELSLGRFEAAFPHYEWRWRAKPNLHRRPFSQSTWGGGTKKESLLLWGEQGVGDEVLWLSLVPDLLAMEHNITVECDPRLVTLLRRSLPTLNVVARCDPPDESCLDPQLRQLPIAELCRHVPRSTNGPPPPPYLLPDPDRTKALRWRLLEQSGGKPLVGLSWRSGVPLFGHFKSMELLQWQPVLEVEDVAFVNLQYGDVTQELAAVAAATNVTVIVADDVDIMADLDGFASLVGAMDVVVTSSNTTVHFAGAVGVETCLLLPKGRGLHWYWGEVGDECRWYRPWVRMLRQDAPGQWDDVLERAAQMVRDHVTHLAS